MGVRDVETLTINISELLGTGDQEGVVAYDLEELAKVILREQPRMAKKRAVKRVAVAVAKLQLENTQAQKH